MSISRIDERYRIVVDKRIRRIMKVKAGAEVILEPVDERSFKVTVIDLDFENLEDDSAWKALHTPAKPVRRIPPEELERIMEEEAWRE
jgi:bifunctional DNA-binding transcriptional regulator/antitoxin component of YhaV-PrlF toxin-antitoxin module